MRRRAVLLLTAAFLQVGCAAARVDGGGAEPPGAVLGGAQGDKGDQPVSLGRTYAVIDAPVGGVPVFDAPSERAEVLRVLDVDALDVEGTGHTVDADGLTWVELGDGARAGETTGWVNAQYLTEMVDPDAFCQDARPWEVLKRLDVAVQSETGEGLHEVVSPRHGLWVFVAPEGAGMHVAVPTEVWRALLEDETSWGAHPATGDEMIGTFQELGLVEFRDVLGGAGNGHDLRCNRLPQGAGAYDGTVPGHLRNMNFITVSVAYDGGWLTWLVGFDYVEGEPFVGYVARLGRDS